MATNFNIEISENLTIETIHEFIDDARTDFAINHSGDELLFCVAAIGYNENDAVTDYDDTLADWEPSRETIFEMCQREIANFEVDENLLEDETRIEIVLEACYSNDEEGVCCYDDIVVATVTIQRRTRDEVIKDIVAWLGDNDDAWNEIAEELDSYSDFLYDDRWYDMDQLEDMLEGKDIIEILNMSKFGEDLDEWNLDSHGNKQYASFNPNRDYFKFNGYGNLVSSNWKDYSDNLDSYAVELIADYVPDADPIKENDDLQALFEELEMAD